MRRKHKKEGMDVYTQLNHISGQQELTHHCKATTFQLKNKQTNKNPFTSFSNHSWTGNCLLSISEWNLGVPTLPSLPVSSPLTSGKFCNWCVSACLCPLDLLPPNSCFFLEETSTWKHAVHWLICFFTFSIISSFFFSFKLLIKFYLKQKSKWGYFFFREK